MHFLTIVTLALALSLDAFAVAIAAGIIIKRKKVYNALKMSFFFGFFQMIMPVMGWLGGRFFYSLLESLAHWISFGLLSIVGLKMIAEAMKFEEIEQVPHKISFLVLIGLSLATSLDAFAVGLSLSLLQVSIVLPVLMIGGITALMSYCGFFIGQKFGHVFEKKMEIIAGLILIGIGFKILFDYLAG